MKATSAKMSERQQAPRTSQREQSLDQTERLLYDFAHAAVVLGTSMATIRRLVASGTLTAVRLNPRSPVAKQYIPAKQIHALAQPGGDDA
jgi:hypothetical protein